MKISLRLFGLIFFAVFLIFAVTLVKANPLGSVKGQNGELALAYTSDDERAILAIKKARPAVATIILTQEITQTVLRFDPSVSGYRSEQRKVKKEISSGTGFFIHPQGYLLTNKHVVSSKNSEITVVTQDNITYPARIASSDPLNDAAVLKVAASGPFPFIELEKEDKIEIGMTVVAIGNALGKFEQSVTKGILSAMGRSLVASTQEGETQSLDDVLQTDAAINVGNSGGPLISLDGKAVGMNTAKNIDGQSIAFAIPSYDLRYILDSFFENGKIIRPYLGIYYQTITDDLVSQHKLPVAEGAFILPSTNEGAVIKGSAADKAGLKIGDIIIAVDGEPVTRKNSLAKIIRSRKPNQRIILEIARGSNHLNLPLILDAIDASLR